MQLLGLTGYPLSHSFSPRWFSEKFTREGITGFEYRLFPMESVDRFPQLIASTPQLIGLNVTIPYKELIIPYLDEVDPVAAGIGAVNTVTILRKEGQIKTKGYNTDHTGFRDSLPSLPSNCRTLILGTGGSSRAVAYALKNEGIPFQFVSRKSNQTNSLAYNEIDRKVLNDHLLIINTTPVGMYPKTEDLPLLPYHFLTEKHILFDLVYNPPVTGFLQKGKEYGCLTINGLAMLHLQAEHAWKIFREITG